MIEYHRIYAQIDTKALKDNVNNIKMAVNPSCMIMPIIKADGYGHGAVRSAEALLLLSDAFGVATIEEALELRAAGIDKPILILGTLSEQHFTEAIQNDISINIYTDISARKLNDIAAGLGKRAGVHIAVDTGMGRIGLSCDDEGLEIAAKLYSYDNIRVEGMFSHFATADEADKAIAIEQRSRFDDFLQKLKDKGFDTGIEHICNSAAICSMNDKCYSMVRPGIIIYGLYPSCEVPRNLNLEPVLSLKSHVSFIKRVKKGEGISYGHTYHAPSERIIATIPVGYADGYPRALSNKGRVLIKGKYAPIVGRVCMDQFMVDITDIEDVRVEDSVTLIGSDGANSISADEIADLCGTINYEIVCGIGKRVPRIYK